MDSIACPLCGSNESALISTYSADHYSFYLCKKCSGIFADPMKSAGKEWYECSEWYQFPAEVSEGLRWYERVFLEDPSLYKGKKVLHIGCGRNDFLIRLKESGCNITALDISGRIVEFTRNVLGIDDVRCSEVSDFIKKYEGERFDTIIFFEVLEHLENPGEFIKSIKRVLREDGSLVLSVPNRDRFKPSDVPWDYPPHHLTRWNMFSLNNFIISNGYHIHKMLVSPLTADSLVRVLKTEFDTKGIERTIRKADANKTDQSGLKKIIFLLFYKLRMLCYKIVEAIARIVFKQRGVNIYTVAGRKH